MLHKNIHRTVLIRLVLTWLILSLVLGAIVFYLEMKKSDVLMLDLAITESRSFTEHLGQDDLTHLTLLKQKADDFLKSGFISVRVYDTTQRKILEVVEPGADEAGLGFKPHVHSPSTDDVSHYHMYWVGGRPFMQVLLPIARDGTRLGYFEGMYEVNTETANNIKAGIIRTLTLTVIVVLATSITFYPIIIFLNKGLLRVSSALLISNVELMEVLGSAIAKRDADTHIHNYRVTIYAIRLAEALRLSQHDIRRLMTGAFLHDVGKIGIADAILRKPASLTGEEFGALRMHVGLGVDIISKANWLESARDVVEFHHEKFDGSGYMKGLRGDSIPLNARIFAIVDVFDALTSRRPYKEPLSFDDATAIMHRGRGSHFDPRLLDVFDTVAPKLFAEIDHAEDAVVEATLRRLVNKYFLSSEDLPRRRDLGAG